ncbi:MAG: DUF305 domain-containing protein [Frankia sp.]|nr:DUF305 domain-containing protein [Frankia sp.]
MPEQAAPADTLGADDDLTPPAPPAHDEAAGRPRRFSWRLWAPLALLVAAALVAGGYGLRGLISGAPGNDSVDAGFLRDMSEHHAQAVQMGMLEFSHGEDPDIIAVAQDIALSQQREIGVMSAWLTEWGLPTTAPGEPMRWMTDAVASGGHDHGTEGGDGTARMPGMATEAEMADLAAARGRDSDVLFLQLMIRHHEGGVAMAQYASLHAETDQVRTIARAMVVVQSSEIEIMQKALERLGVPRV